MTTRDSFAVIKLVNEVANSGNRFDRLASVINDDTSLSIFFDYLGMACEYDHFASVNMTGTYQANQNTFMICNQMVNYSLQALVNNNVELGEHSQCSLLTFLTFHSAEIRFQSIEFVFMLFHQLKFHIPSVLSAFQVFKTIHAIDVSPLLEEIEGKVSEYLINKALCKDIEATVDAIDALLQWHPKSPESMNQLIDLSLQHHWNQIPIFTFMLLNQAGPILIQRNDFDQIIDQVAKFLHFAINNGASVSVLSRFFSCCAFLFNVTIHPMLRKYLPTMVVFVETYFNDDTFTYSEMISFLRNQGLDKNDLILEFANIWD